ncbi:hypothetical protein CPT_Mendera_196 [Stenotrophomonas phage Mendera]|uniref:Uncharacterized protein n=1 Tax=Stenotrophomonas phage Mendera TaxID=2650877 RepID=A0A5P8PJ10_9CAUD|nr:hypothetical protein HWC60_gp219 [Stenotrophomonas phage Mendera]QFR56722.1 hypothetical protein CPT_Mendera_196 [Stenotrophomonas phage Mendera]
MANITTFAERLRTIDHSFFVHKELCGLSPARKDENFYHLSTRAMMAFAGFQPNDLKLALELELIRKISPNILRGISLEIIFDKQYIIVPRRGEILISKEEPKYIDGEVEFTTRHKNTLWRLEDGALEERVDFIGIECGDVFITARDVIDYFRLTAMAKPSLLMAYTNVLDEDKVVDLADEGFKWISTEKDGRMFAYKLLPRTDEKRFPETWVISDEWLFTQLPDGDHATYDEIGGLGSAGLVLQEEWNKSLVNIEDLLNVYSHEGPKPVPETYFKLAGVPNRDGTFTDDEADLQAAFGHLTRYYSTHGNIKVALLKTLEHFIV